MCVNKVENDPEREMAKGIEVGESHKVEGRIQNDVCHNINEEGLMQFWLKTM